MKKNGMVLIPARNASFQMGSINGNEDERPVHTVRFTYDFWMDTTEVTQKQYQLILTAYNNSALPSWGAGHGAGDQYPAYAVEWGDAALYCNALSKRDGLDTVYVYTSVNGRVGDGCSLDGVTTAIDANGYRLPTEAEWEYACRAGTTTDFYWGKNFVAYPATPADSGEIDLYAIWSHNAWDFHAEHPNFGTHPVASKKPNAFGLYDMSGNVFEWIHDWYSEYSSAEQTDPMGSSEATYRFVRGGSWGNGADFLRASNRRFASPDYYIYFCGFRTMLPVNPTRVSESAKETVSGCHLDQNYPNPFNPSTTIQFYLPTASKVILAIYNGLGQQVALLFDHQQFSAGEQAVFFDAKNLPVGIYYYRLETEAGVQIKKMTLIK